jgi:predicted small metal-binding protein
VTKAISCRDVGVDCDFTARGETAEDVMSAYTSHAKETHGFDSISPEFAEELEAAMDDE